MDELLTEVACPVYLLAGETEAPDVKTTESGEPDDRGSHVAQHRRTARAAGERRIRRPHCSWAVLRFCSRGEWRTSAPFTM